MIAPIVNIVAKFNPQARLFFAVVLGMGFAIDGAYTILLNLYLLRLDYGTEFIGLVNAAGLLSFALVCLPAGILGSQMSVTRLMKLGGLMVLIGAICLPLVELLPLAWRGSWLVFHYALMLAGFAFFFVNGAPFLMNTVDSQHKIHAFALKSAHLALAAFAGSLVGGMMPEWIVGMGELTLDDPAPYRLTMHVVALVLGASFVLLQFIRPLENPIQKLPQPSAEPSATTDGSKWTASFIALIGVMTFIRLFQVAGTATTYVYFNVYMDTQLGVSAGVIGGIAAIGRLIAVPMALFVPTLVRRWGNVNIIIWGSLATALFLLPLALVEHWLAAAIGFIGVSSIGFIRYTAFVVYILDLVPKVQQSVMAGTGEMAAGFSFAIMALGGGIILSLFSFRDLFLLGAALSFMGTFIFWWHCRKAKPKRQLATV